MHHIIENSKWRNPHIRERKYRRTGRKLLEGLGNISVSLLFNTWCDSLSLYLYAAYERNSLRLISMIDNHPKTSYGARKFKKRAISTLAEILYSITVQNVSQCWDGSNSSNFFFLLETLFKPEMFHYIINNFPGNNYEFFWNTFILYLKK